MKRTLSILLIFISLVAITALASNRLEYKEGDIVFQISKSKQSPLVQYATGSVWSHCGIVIEKGGQLYVLEASNVVKLTPLDEWKDRGKFHAIKSKRVFDTPVKIKYSKYLGQPYDLAFKFNNGKMYCSELVYEIYKKQFGIELCTPQPIKSYHTLGLKKKMSQRGMNQGQLVVAPSDLLTYKHFK